MGDERERGRGRCSIKYGKKTRLTADRLTLGQLISSRIGKKRGNSSLNPYRPLGRKEKK